MMKKVITSLFALYQLSAGNRILLQQIPQTPAVIPEAVPPLAPPVIPEPLPPLTPPIEALPIPHPEADPVLSTHAPAVPLISTTTPIPVIVTTTNAPIEPTLPTTTAAPIAPDGFQFGAFGQLCPAMTTQPAQCVLPTDILTDANTGRVRCSHPSDCCMCATIECGFGAVPCRQLQVGASAAFGVKDIKISGAEVGTGALIDCQGVDSCRETMMNGRNIIEIDCNAAGSCQDAVITVSDPTPNFGIECTGTNACAGLKLDILFSGPPTGYMCAATKRVFMMSGIECNGELSCEGMEITIDNAGCDHVVIDSVECIGHNACNAAVFNLIGDVDIRNCQCGPSCSNARGLDKCFNNLEYLLCPDPLSCMGITKTVTNPAHEFEMICSNVQSCENSNFLLEVVPDTMSNTLPATAWKGFTLRGLNAARGATFTIDNQLSNILDVDVIDCRGPQSCAHTTFITGVNVIIEDVICAPGACYGCVIKSSVADVGMPCDASQVASPELVQPIQVLPVNPGPIVDPQPPQAPPQTIPGPWVPV